MYKYCSHLNLDPENCFVSFNIEYLYTYVQAKNIIEKKLRDDDELHESTQLLRCCLFYYYLPMGSPFSLAETNIHMEYLENLVIESSPVKSKM